MEEEAGNEEFDEKEDDADGDGDAHISFGEHVAERGEHDYEQADD